MVGDFLIGPPTGGQHGYGKLSGGEVAGHIMAGDGVVHFTPARRETIGYGNDPFEILWPFRFDDSL